MNLDRGSLICPEKSDCFNRLCEQCQARLCQINQSNERFRREAIDQIFEQRIIIMELRESNFGFKIFIAILLFSNALLLWGLS
jgi:hypothetical protein